MTRVSITELKAQLSRYLREVRRGGEVQVLDRGVPVARITRVESSGQEGEQERRQRLVEAGIVRPGAGGMASVVERPPLELAVDLAAALGEQRADRL
jgi:prevent-host-death family protein